ncbi:hypothetical protein ACFY8X_30335 [Streptomyces tanashiensis]|uniref:hypothetical protein n=1 Tax=Streptomyces tanashiensis TaxID=67367 RepID=UPI0019B14F4E|nr:hypothetical protein GCM10010299_47690 [Streptomyces tanashiensis]
MGESVPVNCPECLRTHAYAAPALPCVCGSPVAPPVAAGAVAQPITHRNWTDEWVTVRCEACGRENDWPHPELGCPCGTVLRVPVRPVEPGPWPVGGTGAEAGCTPPGTAGGVAGTGGGSVPARDPGPSPSPSRTDPGSPLPTPEGRDLDPRPGTGRHGTSGSAAGGTTDGARDAARGRSDGDRPDGDRPDGDRPVGPAGGGASAGEGCAGAGPADPPAVPVEPGSPWFGPGPGSRGGAGAAGLGADGPGPAAPRTFAERYPAHIPLPVTAPRPAPLRGAFRPVTIRTSRDAVAAAAGYLRWLGFRDVVQPEERPASGVDLRAPGLVAQVDPSTRPTGLRAVECLWLNGLSTSAVSVFFSLAGYTPEARSRAAELGLPLFVLDLTGTPQPVSDAAEGMAAGGA